MSDLRNKIKRQIELLGLVLNSPDHYKVVDFEVFFNCNEATIKRDLKGLRSLGIDIHSVSRKGIRVDNKIENKTLNELINDYFLLSSSSINIEKTTHFLVQSKKESALTNLTLIQHCIDRNLMILISYKKPNKKNIDTREVVPINIFYGQNEYRLFALDERVYKQFLLSRIESVEITKKKYKQITKDRFADRFTSSIDVWLGDKTYNVRMLLTKSWLINHKLPLLTENQIIIQNSDGSMLLEVEVNSLVELSRWIVAQGKGIKVIEPKKLQKSLLEIAYSTIYNYLP